MPSLRQTREAEPKAPGRRTSRSNTQLDTLQSPRDRGGETKPPVVASPIATPGSAAGRSAREHVWTVGG